jgi:peptidoglycan/xylan/chitin deacetylase (PgdA/CDA1 family)
VRRQSKPIVLVLITVLALTAASCQVAKAGGRCKTTALGRDAKYVLVCKNGRWQRGATIDSVAKFLAALAKQKAAAAAPAAAAPAAVAPAAVQGATTIKTPTTLPATTTTIPATTTTSTTTIPTTTTTIPLTYNGIVPNGSMESANLVDGTKPANWVTGQFPAAGTAGSPVASFSWLAGGAHGGNKSLQAQITTAGAAGSGVQWSFDPVAVTPSGYYHFTGWYKSSAATEVVAKFTTSGGAISYVQLATPAVAANWTQLNQDFQAPAGVATITIVQSLNVVGSFQLDDVSVTTTTNPPANNLGIVPNGDFEKARFGAPTLPESWNQFRDLPTTAATFTYPTGGAHSGSHSVRAEITAGAGAAWWGMDAQPASTSTPYHLQTWYESNVPTEVYVVYTSKTNVVTYGYLGAPAAAATWTLFDSSFTTPADVATITTYQVVKSVGWVQNDDTSISTSPTFNRALVSLTFDDGYKSNVTTALPKLNTLGLTGTFFLESGLLANPSANDLTPADANTLLAAGNELGAHTETHPDLTTRTAAQLDTELVASKAKLKTLVPGSSFDDFASPFGAYNDTVRAKIMANYLTHRTVSPGVNTRSYATPGSGAYVKTDFSRLSAKQVLSTTTAADVTAWIADAVATKSWLILVFHDVLAAPTAYDTTPTQFGQVMDAIGAAKNSGVTFETMAQARAEISPQLVP